jgi:hypothetical protein
MVLDSDEHRRHLAENVRRAASAPEIAFLTIQSAAKWHPTEYVPIVEAEIL